MKKTFAIIIAVAMVVGLAMSVQAADTVQMTLTAPSITKSGCEKAGSVTYSFADGTVLNVGDWWYFDLDEGATLCKTIDYFILGAVTGVPYNAADKLLVTNENGQIVDDYNANANNTIVGINGSTIGDGPFKLVGTGTITGTALGGNSTLGDVYLRIKGDAGSRRIYVYVYGDQAVGSLTFNLPAANDQVTLTLLNGFAYDGTTAGIAGGTTTGLTSVLRKDTSNYSITTATVPGTPASNPGIAVGTYPAYGQKIPENGESSVPFVQNSLCVNAANFPGNDIYISLNSKNDFLTFSGDSKIAHVADESLKLALCKADKPDNILIATQGSCSYNMLTSTGDCDTATNRIIVTTDSPFSGQEAFDVSVQSLTSGVYFGGTANIGAFSSSMDPCTVAAAKTYATNKNSNEAGTEDVAPAGNSCTINATNRVNKVWTTGGLVNALNTYNALAIDMPNLNYDTSMIAAGTEVKVTVTIDKKPCGGALSETFTLGTFVTTCPSTSGGTTMVYPFLPPMAGLDAWWGGFTATNMSGADGTIDFTFMEYDGDKATLTVSVKNGETYVNLSGAALLAAVTVDPANAGTFGDSNLVIKAACSFTGATGMTFTGNGTEGVGYTAKY